MTRRRRVLCRSVLLAAVVITWSSALHGQVGASAKACSLLPVADLEALFGAKAGPLRGTDTSTVSMCAANFPDVRHPATVQVRPPVSGEAGVSIEQRLAMTKAIEQGKFESQVIGDIGCVTIEQDLGKPLPATTCFRSEGGYLAVTVGSDNAKHVSFAVVSELLKKAAAKRK
jgi:hypothetical protein